MDLPWGLSVIVFKTERPLPRELTKKYLTPDNTITLPRIVPSLTSSVSHPFLWYSWNPFQSPMRKLDTNDKVKRKYYRASSLQSHKKSIRRLVRLESEERREDPCCRFSLPVPSHSLIFYPSGFSKYTLTSLYHSWPLFPLTLVYDNIYKHLCIYKQFTYRIQ